MEIWPERWYDIRQRFFCLMREPAPTGDVGWTEDVGTQPAPVWLPAVWRTLDTVTPSTPESSAVQVELLAFDAGRVTGVCARAPRMARKREFVSASSPTAGSHRVMAAVGSAIRKIPAKRQASFRFRVFTGLLVADGATVMMLFSEQEARQWRQGRGHRVALHPRKRESRYRRARAARDAASRRDLFDAIRTRRHRHRHER
jgi:hypothetical protein